MATWVTYVTAADLSSISLSAVPAGSFTITGPAYVLPVSVTGAQGIADALLLAPSGVAAAGSAMAELAAILEDTGTTLPAVIAAGGGLDLDTALEQTMTFGEALRIMLAALAGETSGSGTPALTFLGQDGTTVRISATVDGLGNRTAVTVDGAE